jgi:hypothetical protein
MKLSAIVGAVALTLWVAAPAFANMAPPRVVKAKPTGPQLSVLVDTDAKTSTLTLPAAEAKEKADAADVVPPAFASAQTMAIGGALALSIMCGGFWLIRGRPKNRSIAILLITVGAFGVPVAFADVPPPPRPKPVPNENANSDKAITLADGVSVMVEQGKTKDYTLRLTSADAAKLAAGIKALPAPLNPKARE